MKEWIGINKINEGDYGFVYIIWNVKTGHYYVGKKCLKSYKTINKKKVWRESNWKTYMGSNKDFLDHIKLYGKENFKREIIMSCRTSIDLTYHEIEQMIINKWRNELCYNQNILGKIFKQRLTKDI